MHVTVHDSIASIGASSWDGIAGTQYPFLNFAFLDAAEQTRCVAPETGWRPCHLTLDAPDGTLRAAMLLYEKQHSWGEFVFDWAWAHAYERAGLDYYPKLVSAVPFTPVPNTRLLLTDPDDREGAETLIHAAVALAEERKCSSLHLLFPEPAEIALLESAGLKVRKDCQFHWRNDGYENFDDFLARFSSAKRKKVRRDRRRVAEAGIRFRRLGGREMGADLWQVVYRLISRTFMRRGSMPYFNLAFFERLSRALPDEVLVIIAEDGVAPVAAAVFFVSEHTLYGRYWGSAGHYNALHFETCYYQGIDYCIEHGIRHFNPGTQGEHKISRGFLPVETWSAHWLAQPAFFSAIGEYVDEESRHIDQYIDAIDDHSPFRKDRGR